MSDYKIENREEVTNVLLERVVSNAPIRELLRVYSEACQSAIAGLSDADVARSIQAAGYLDILEGFNLEVPAPEETPEGEGEATAE
jgi:hypothetical protein